jgi:fluoride exporter
MEIFFWVVVGCALGGAARYGLSGLIARHFGETFPWGTLIVNVTGSFAIGFFATLSEPEGRSIAGPAFRQFFMTGVCGGYTTFSSFSLQTLNLVRDGEFFKAGMNVVFSPILCLVAVWMGRVAALLLDRR